MFKSGRRFGGVQDGLILSLKILLLVLVCMLVPVVAMMEGLRVSVATHCLHRGSDQRLSGEGGEKKCPERHPELSATNTAEVESTVRDSRESEDSPKPCEPRASAQTKVRATSVPLREKLERARAIAKT